MQLVKKWWELPWWASGKKSLLPLQGAQIQSLVREQRSPPCHMAWTKKILIKNKS